MDPTPVMPRRPRRRAAILVAVVGLIEAVLLGCCAGGMLMSEVSLTELEQSPLGLPPDMTQEQLRGVARAVRIIVAASSVALFVLPGLALMVLSPWIDRGARGPTLAARVILWVHVVLVGGVLLLNVAMSAVMLSVLNLLVSLVFMGGLLAAQVAAIRALGAGGRVGAAGPPAATADDDGDFEPWNSHLM